MIAMTRRRALAGLSSLAGTIAFSGCAINPVTGKTEFMLMSEDKEISMGEEAHGQIVAEYGAYNDTALQEWFTTKGVEMAKVSHRKNLPWHFTVLDSPVVNAFAVPGGYVYVTRGILGYFTDEAQFAGVLGHELGHVTARHSAARYSKLQMANLGILLGSIVSEDFRNYSQLASLGTTMLFLKFSRDDERQADKLGVEYSSLVGYDATHVSDFFHTLERMSPGGGSLPEWQSTHPNPGDRVNATRSQAITYQKKHSGMTFNYYREEYLERIDGLVFGDNPEQGYVENDVFYHPTLRLRFDVPVGWQVSNKPSEVRMGSEDQKAVLVFTLGAGETVRESADKFQATNEITVNSVETITVNGNEGLRTAGVMASGEQNIGIASYYIGMQGHVYTFHGLSAEDDLPGYDGAFSKTARSFGLLDDPTKLTVTPKRIAIRQAPKNATLKEVLNGMGVGEDELNELSIMNGLELTDTVSAGQRLKVLS